jgi:autophagy-related protein 9
VDVQDFCRNKLGISDTRLQYMPWPEVLHRLVRLQRSVKLCLTGELSEHDIVMRLMRRDDYLIGAPLGHVVALI